MDILFSNLFPIIFIAIVAFIMYGRFKKKKDTVLKSNLHQQTEADAQAIGIGVTAQANGRVTSGEVTGDTDYNGTTGGIDWTLRSTVMAGGSSSRGGSRVWKRKSTWRTSAAPMPAGKFIMLMSTPGEMKTGQIQRGGLMNTLINKAADAVLDLYVSGYFGSEYQALVSIGEDGVKLDLEGLGDFMILTNHEAVARRYFDAGTTATISNWKQSNQGFAREREVDQFGLLFSPDGIILTCQANMSNAEEVKQFSNFGAALTAKMKMVMGG